MAVNEKRVRSGLVSRVLSPSCPARGTTGDGHFSRGPIARRLKRPTRKSITARTVRGDRTAVCAAAAHCSLFGLAPGGVCLAKPVARLAGELLPRRFTLTSPAEPSVAVYFLLHFPWPRGRWALPITVSVRCPDFPPAEARAEALRHCACATGGHRVHSEPIASR